MSIFGKKQELFSQRAKPEKMPFPKKEIKEEPKDTSIFGGKPSIEKRILNQHLKDPKLYQSTRLGQKEIEKIGEELFGQYKDIFKKTNIKEIKDQLNLGRWGKFKGMSSKDKRRAKIIIKEISGK